MAIQLTAGQSCRSLRVRIVSHMLDAITSPPQRSIWMHRGVWKRGAEDLFNRSICLQSGRSQSRAMGTGVKGKDASQGLWHALEILTAAVF